MPNEGKEDCKDGDQEIINETDEAKSSVLNEPAITSKIEDQSEKAPETSSTFLQVIDSKLVSNALLSLESKVEEISKDKELPPGEPISFKVVYNKTKYDVDFPLEGTIRQLKEQLAHIINVLPTMQKVMIKGMAKDDKTLKELGVTKGAKIMVVGSKLNDLVSVNAPKPTKSGGKCESSPTVVKEAVSKQKIHAKVIDKGKPEDSSPGIKNCNDVLPMQPLSGMLNKHGGKLRLTFKLELDQVWVGTKERTEKINMSSIQQIVSEPIEGHEGYHMVALQLGPTEASRYWVYWVPSQYVNAIKDTILGKW